MSKCIELLDRLRVIHSLLILILMILTGCNRDKPGTNAHSQGQDIVNVTTTLAVIAEDNHYAESKAKEVRGSQDIPEVYEVFFSETGRGVAYTIQKDNTMQVVHNGKPEGEYTSVGDVTFSPDGRRLAYEEFLEGRTCMVADGAEGACFEAVLAPEFSPDSKHIAWRVQNDELWYLVIDDNVSDATRAYRSGPLFNSDSTMIAYVEAAIDDKKGRLVVSDLNFNEKTLIVGIETPMITNENRTRIAAVSEENGMKRVIELSFASPNDIKKGPPYDTVNNLVFGLNGNSLAYMAEKSGERFIVFDGKEERMPEGTIFGLPVIRPDLEAVGLILTKNNIPDPHGMTLSAGGEARFIQLFGDDAGEEKIYDDVAFLVYNRDGSVHAYTARSGQNWFVVVNGKEAPAFDMVVSPQFSPDGKKLIYRARKDGRRFVVVSNTEGNTISQHPDYEQVFQPVFTADGKSVAYGVKDGNKLIWKVEKLDNRN